MKKIVLALIIALLIPLKAQAYEFNLIRCTCYTAKADAITASGQVVREGTIAAQRSRLGGSVLLYDMDKHYIGMFEVTDTGAGIDTDGDGKGDSIKNGKSIDVFRDNLDRCYEWINKYGDYVYIVWLRYRSED